MGHRLKFSGFVQTNIEKFGGDPTRVKYNESAGAAAVQCDSSTTIAQCLRESSELALRTASDAISYKYQLGPLLLTIPDLPSRLIASSKFAKVSVFAGHTTFNAFLHLAGVKPIGANAFGNKTEEFRGGIARRTHNFTDANNAKFEEILSTVGREPGWFSGRHGFDRYVVWMTGLARGQCPSINAGVNQLYLFRWDATDPSRIPWNNLKMAVHATGLYYIAFACSLEPEYNFTGVATLAWKVLNATENASAKENTISKNRVVL
ncbi:hypothetical protein Moror_4623 [Moniliophthora roreri MCA 2997]|uniref:Uncharacterized protein n=1 Tax=Moniliophthora roreri (strain MCA 2997) TaxID=1381753 RepID=V2WZQ2_MONRO|nr:hypothetical protein Moror_4623 [Moniliophthora roreri MCA 2997]